MGPKFDYPDKYVSSKKDIPLQKHWAIIEIGSITIPGDERSRQCPGHGYPEHTETTLRYEVYLTEQKWKDQIAYRESKDALPLYGYKRDYVALVVTPAQVTVTTSVEVV